MSTRKIIYDLDAYNLALAEIKATTIRAVDTETTGLDYSHDLVCGVCVHLPTRSRSYYFSFRHGEGPNLPEDLIAPLANELHRHSVIGHNYQFDAKMLSVDGVKLPARFDDTILAAHLVNENEPSYKLEDLTKKYIDPTAGDAEDELIALIVKRFGGAKSKAKGKLWCLSAEEVGHYGMQDVESTWALHDFYTYWLRRKRLRRIYREECSLSLELAKMEIRGVRLDAEKMRRNAEACERELAPAKATLQEIAGFACNPSSPKQMIAVLGTKDTRAQTIETMNTPAAKALLHYRKVYKAVHTYYRPFETQVDGAGDLHASFRIAGGWRDGDGKGGTVAGRLSCQNPNLFAVTRGTGNCWNVRDVFVAREGFKLVELDFSQAELRIASHYSQCHTMAQMFRDGIDVHSGVANELGVARSVAKAVNFSFLYGIGAYTFSEKYHYTYREAKAYLDGFDRRFPEFRLFSKKLQAHAENHRMIRLWTGRIRHYNSGWKTKTKDAMNNLVQGAVAEMIRRSILGIARMPGKHRMLLSIYDSVISEVPIGEVDRYITRAKDLMEDQAWCGVPIRVDAKVGDSWGGLKEYERANQ